MTLPNRPVLQLIRVAILAALVVAQRGIFVQRSSAEPPSAIDDARAQSAGIRKLRSNHLVLYTDVPSSPSVDGLPAVFDKAVSQWAAYFGVDVAKTNDWQPRAFLIDDRRRFAALGLLPPGNDEFANGITFGSQMWLREQPTDYYRRHLLLHEGTHAFMFEFLGGCGPGWYMEGIAELLGTHRLDPKTGELTLGIMPRSRQEVPMLGRIKLIKDALTKGRRVSLPALMKFDNRQQLGDEAYAWCWAAAKFLDSHPRYRDRFHQLYHYVREKNFNDLFRRDFADDWPDLNSEWNAYIATLDYGYDFDRMAIGFETGKPLAGQPRTATIKADRGWQSSGAWLEAGKSYELTAQGHFQIAAEGRGRRHKTVAM